MAPKTAELPVIVTCVQLFVPRMIILEVVPLRLRLVLLTVKLPLQ